MIFYDADDKEDYAMFNVYLTPDIALWSLSVGIKHGGGVLNWLRYFMIFIDFMVDQSVLVGWDISDHLDF